jgi:hypothetical protein
MPSQPLCSNCKEPTQKSPLNVYKRSVSWLKNKEKKTEWEKEKKTREEESQCTFHPSTMGEAREDRFMERNERWKRNRQRKLERRVQQKLEEEMKEVTGGKDIKIRKDYRNAIKRRGNKSFDYQAKKGCVEGNDASGYVNVETMPDANEKESEKSKEKCKKKKVNFSYKLYKVRLLENIYHFLEKY